MQEEPRLKEGEVQLNRPYGEIPLMVVAPKPANEVLVRLQESYIGLSGDVVQEGAETSSEAQSWPQNKYSRLLPGELQAGRPSVQWGETAL
jgi:hypothetical protein